MNSTQPIPSSPPRCSACSGPIPADSPGSLCPRCLLGAALGPADTLAVPEGPPPPGPHAEDPSTGPATFGDYELLEELGRGGMGIVWRARHRRLQREVALKLVLQGAFASPSERQRFQAEAQAVAALDHPGIIPVYEVGEHEGRPYFAMRLVRGGNLGSGALRAGLEPRRSAELVARIARAVHHAHQRGILHRDLKPANILVDAGQPVVADFGLAKRLDAHGDLTASGAVLGSPAYMAPEQASGRLREVSTASDVYSLGAILYDLLAGEPPFRAETPLATLRLVAEAQPAPLRDRHRAIDRNLETICLQCLAKQPRDRYGSAEALADDLERWLRRETIRARPTPLWERAWNWTRRHPSFALAILAVLATAGLGIAAFLGQFRQTQLALERARATTLAERSARAAIVGASQTWTFDAEVRTAAPSPDGTRLLVAAGTRVQILSLPRGEPLATLSGHTSSVRLAQWSADGRRVLTTSTCQDQPVWDDPTGPYGDQTVRVWDATTGTPVASLDNPLGDVLMSSAISPDGRRVALGAVHGETAWWEPDGSTPPTIWPAFDVQVRALTFDPQGRRLLANPGDKITWIRRPMPNGGTFGHIGLHADTTARLFAVGSTQEVCHIEPVTRLRVPHWQFTPSLRRPIESTRTVGAFGPDGRWCVTGGIHPANTAIWNAEDGALIHRLVGHTQAVHAVAISMDGTRAATGGLDPAARVWDTRTGRLLASLGPHPRNVLDLEFAPNPRWVLTVCADQKIRIWDVELGICVALLRGHSGTIHDAHFVTQGEEVVSASADRTVRRWRWATFEQMAQSLEGHGSRICSVRFDSRGDRVVAGAFDGTARIWSVEGGRLLHHLDPGPDYGAVADATVRANGGAWMRDAVFSPDGLQVVSARTDPIYSRSASVLAVLGPRFFAPAPSPQPWTPGQVWDVASGRAVGAISATNLAFAGVVFAPEGRRMIFRSDSMPRHVSSKGWWRYQQSSYSHGHTRSPFGQAELFEYPSLRRLAVLGGHSGELSVATFAPDGSLILTADAHGVLLWNGQGTFERELLEAEGRDWTGFAPDGRTVLSQDRDKIVALFDAATGSPVRRFPEIAKDIWEAWFALDGSEIGSIDTHGNLATFDTRTGQPLWVGRGSGVNTGITLVSPDRRWMATVVGEQTIDLWDLRHRRLVRSIERHLYPITELSFDSAGKWLASGDLAGTVWIWPLRLADESALP